MQKVRSQGWFGKNDRDGFAHRSGMKNQGWPADLFDGRPVIEIATPGPNLQCTFPRTG
jgi:dihydroxy-acid dehydratase